MTLSREEIAVRVLQGFAAFEGPCDPKNYAATAVEWSDALLRALTPTPAPVAPPAGKYEPRVGDVVRYKGGATFGAGGLCVLIAPSKKSSNGAWKAYALDDGCPHGDPIPTMSYYWEYLRPATPSELAAAGLSVPPPAPTPAPEDDAAADARIDAILDDRKDADAIKAAAVRQRAEHRATYGPESPAPEEKRPTVDRAYDRVVAVRDYLDLLVSIQPETRRITAALAASIGYVLPAPCPPPVAGRGGDDVERAARALVENRGATYSVATNPPSKFVMIPSAYFEALRAALSRPVRP